MLHAKRQFSVENIEAAEQLAEMLCDRSWCLCQGFRHRGYLMLNDATSEDGAQEFAAYKELEGGLVLQVDSLTISWMDREEIDRCIQKLTEGNFDHVAKMLRSQPQRLQLETPEEHGTCRCCR
jgi:hypothetical protein